MDEINNIPNVFWHIDMHEFHDDEGELIVYATAHCPWCKMSYHDNKTIVCRQTNYYNRPSPQENPTEEEKENVRQDVRERVQKSVMNMPPFCEWCGAKLRK